MGKQILIHVPGDREAVIRFLDENKIKYKMRASGSINIWNTYIELDNYGDYGSRLYFDTYSAKIHQGKPVIISRKKYGVCSTYREQEKLYNALKKSIQQSRQRFYVKTEERMQRERQARDERLKKIHQMIDFENNVLREEHQLEKQIQQTIEFIRDLQKDFPQATFFIDKQKAKIDNKILENHIEMLNDILIYLQDEKVETVHILKDIEKPIQLKKVGKELKQQKKHIKKLSSKLNKFVREVRYFLRVWVREFQITTPMRKHLYVFYEQILKVYEWYAGLFKRETERTF